MASSVVEICNLALSHAGAGGPIASLSESSNEARECSLHYSSCRDAVLTAHDWGFATRQVALADLDNAPEGWAYEYQYPADCLRIRAIRAGGYDPNVIIYANEPYPAALGTTVLYPPVPYEIAVTSDGTARVIWCDAYQAYATYTAAIEIVTLFPPLVADAISFLLASRITPRLTGKRDTMSDLYKLYQVTLGAAMAKDAGEAHSIPAPEPDWMRARS